ncbi:golgin subfamily A member 6-like protein 22 [Orbicella faveolata]|uniref:golgin subfamily A member 6-like protein 22 n=1 Tax=Orbicella faveolata TaxID=48498 RepID=UPI0009E5E18F|nr:golgin subfamily A member 6-like protein 22 [Orbicella faveolata]
MKQRLSSVDEQERMLTRVIEEKLQLEENKKLDVYSLQMALEERTREKERLEENLETWREKYAGLESDVARLQNELVSAVEKKCEFEERFLVAREEGSVRTKELEVQVKQLEERLSSADEQERRLRQVTEEKLQLEENKKLEVESLQMVLEKSRREKERLEKNFETWREICASLKSDRTLLENDLDYAEEEKRRFGLSVAESTKELPIQVKQLWLSLFSVDEIVQMMTQVIEKKLQLEEDRKLVIECLQIATEQSRQEEGRLQETIESLQIQNKGLERLVEQCKNLSVKDLIQPIREVYATVYYLDLEPKRKINEKKECEQTLERSVE